MNKKKRGVAWTITGSGDKLTETVAVMKEMNQTYGNLTKVEVFLSKAAINVTKQYKVEDDLKRCFDRVLVELDANSPFLAGWLQSGRYDFLFVAPATSNTVAKIALGIADSLVANAAIMGLKAFVPVYVLPSDFREGSITTKLPDGRAVRLRVRKEDADNVRKLEKMEGVSVLEKPEEIRGVFKKNFGSG
jgi:archaeoflavoprotein AfpA